jgi:uncharacterized protein YkwD
MNTLPRPRSHYSDARPRSLLFILLAIASTLGAAQDKGAGAPFFDEAEQRVTALTNQFRKQNGLAPLDAEARLTETARYFAGYLASTGKLDHDADGTQPADRVKKHGYNYCMVAENLASEYSTGAFTPERLSQNFVEGWRGSPTHRENMLLPDVTQIGVAVARSPKDGEYFAVQVFARPMSQMVKFRVTNRSNATVRYEFRNRTIALGPRQGRLHESCVASPIRLETGGEHAALTPKDGARYIVTESGRNAFRLQEE